MRRNLILASIVLAVLLSCLFAVAVEADYSTWSRTYGGPETDEVVSLVATSDGGYAIAGITRSFGAGRRDFWLIKADANGTMDWNITYGGSTDDVLHDMVATSDGGYAMVGHSRLIKTDASGNIELNKTYEKYRFYSLVQMSDGGYALAGNEVTDSGSLGAWYLLVKTDAAGNVEWTKTYKEPDFHAGVFKVLLVATSDGGYLLAGGKNNPHADDTTGDVWLVKTNSTGYKEWDQTYRRQYDDEVNAVIETNDGGYVIAGSSGGARGLPPIDRSHRNGVDVPCDFWLFKIDGAGNRVWEKVYGGEGWDYAYSLIATSDGGYAITGSLDRDCWLVKTDASGNMEWNRTYDGKSFSSLVQVSTEGYVLAGNTHSPDGEDPDFWLMKTDEFGVSPDLIIDSQTQLFDSTAITVAVTAVTLVLGVALLVDYEKLRKS